jgi:predicted aspartyl protease
VEINDRTYKFLLDTGAPTVISPEIAEDLHLKPELEKPVTDSQGNTSKEKFVTIPQIKLNRILFKNIGAVVMDLKKTFEFRCLNVDGIFGANQMAKGVWKIDYANKSLEISNDFKSLGSSDFKAVLDFIPQPGQKTPVVKLNVDGKEIMCTYDTGFSGAINLKMETNARLIQKYEKIEFEGISNVGAYGNSGPTKGAIVKVPEMSLGSLDLSNQLVFLSTSNLIGNELLKNFTTIIDWSTNKIYLKQEKEIAAKSYTSFGFKYLFFDNKPFVVQLFKNYTGELKSGDRILSINGVDLRQLNETEACFFRFNTVGERRDTQEVFYERNNKEYKTLETKAVYFK